MALSIDRTLRLPDREHFPESYNKTGICIHHTVGGSASSTVRWWIRDSPRVATAYLVARDGTIHEVFDPQHWAWQFGLKRNEWSREEKVAFEKRFIGIEIASEGGLIESNGNLYCFDKISNRTLVDRAEAFDYGKPYRGYRYYAKYTPQQLTSVQELVNQLCDQFNIPRRTPAIGRAYYGKENMNAFQGIIGHVHVRLDKTDPIPDEHFWDSLSSACNLQRVNLPLPLAGSGFESNISQAEIEALFEHNIKEILKLDLIAGTLIKQLILELEKEGRDTYIRLSNALEGGFEVEYEMVSGDPELVIRVARALGYETFTNSKLGVYQG